MRYPRTTDKKSADKLTFQLDEKRWKSLIYRHWNELVDELSKSLVALNEKAEAMRFVPEYLYIHYLRTSVLNELPFFRLDFYDAEKWNGNTHCWVYWDAGVVTDLLFAYMPKDTSEHLSNRGEMENAKLERKWLQTADILHGIMEKAIKSLLEEALAKILDKTPYIDDCDIFYGEYMGVMKRIKSIIPLH